MVPAGPATPTAPPRSRPPDRATPAVAAVTFPALRCWPALRRHCCGPRYVATVVAEPPPCTGGMEPGPSSGRDRFRAGTLAHGAATVRHRPAPSRPPPPSSFPLPAPLSSYPLAHSPPSLPSHSSSLFVLRGVVWGGSEGVWHVGRGCGLRIFCLRLRRL